MKNVLTIAPLIACLLLWHQVVLGSTKTEVVLQNEISRLIEGRLDKRLYLVFVTVKKDPKKKGDEAQNLPLAPFGIDKNLLNQKLKSALQVDEIDIDNIEFTININFDESIADSTIEAIRSSIQKRFSIDNVARKLDISKSKIYTSSNNVKDESLERNEKMNTEISKLESEKSKALIESERTRLELAKKELEFQKGQAKLEDQIRKEVEKSGPIIIAKDFQTVIAAILGLVAIVLGLRLWGASVKSGMAVMADGIRAAAQGIGEALNSQKNQNIEEKNDQIAAQKPKDQEVVPEQSDPNWSHGNTEFDTYIAHMQEKIEVLGRENNFAFVRQFTDMIEDDKTLPLAASLLVAVPNELARMIVQDVGSDHLRRIHKFLESPGGLAAAKSLHKKALQEFYGRIAIDEFTNSPLMTIKNITWLTRMTSEQMADFAFRLPQKYRAAFIACLSPHRTKSMLQSAKRREVRESIVRAITSLGDVNMEKLNEFLEYAKTSPEITQRNSQKSGFVDDMNYIAEIMSELEPEDEEILSAAISGNANLQAKIYQFYLPFKSITRVSKEWISQIFESRQKAQIALILFDADTNVREYIISCLTGIKAEAVKEDLKNLDEDKVYLLKNKKQSRKLQREVSAYVLGLVNSGTIELENENKSGQKNQSEKRSTAA